MRIEIQEPKELDQQTKNPNREGQQKRLLTISGKNQKRVDCRTLKTTAKKKLQQAAKVESSKQKRQHKGKSMV